MSKYSQLKMFHFKEKIDSLPIEVKKIEAPLHVRIKPTNICNHNCWYCAYKVDNLQVGQDMVVRDQIPEDKMLEIIDDCIEMGVKSVTFSGGGEPFLYKPLLTVVKKLAASPIKFATLTNGTRLKGEIAEIFAKHATWVRVSIDGWDDKSYAEYRNTKKNEFSTVIENMKNFKLLGGDCNLGVSFIIDQKNYLHVYEFIKLVKSIGVDSIKLSACVVDSDIQKNNAYHEPIFNEVKTQVNQAMKELAGESFEIYETYHLIEGKFDKEYEWCPYTQILPIIGADMNIYTCQDKAYNLDTGLMGSIKSQRFKEFWYSDKANFMKVNPKRDCSHHCIANDKNKMLLEYLSVEKEHIGFV